MDEQRNSTCLMEFTKTDHVSGVSVSGKFDIINGKFDYQGDIPITDAARMLFDTLALNCGKWWVERASETNNDTAT